MIKAMKTLKKIPKNLILLMFVVITAAFAVYTITRAADENNSKASSDSADTRKAVKAA